jgi:rod shape-determining protein MreC
LNFFAFDLRKILVVIAVVALPIISINMKRAPGEAPWYQKPFSWTISLMQDSYSNFTSGVRGTTSMYMNLIGIKRQNQSLLRENEELRAQLGSIEELKLENQRLSKLLEFREQTKMKLLAAKVIARDLNPDHESIRINRGYREGLRKLQGIITVNGVVGYVVSTQMDSAQVILLTDRSASIDALVQRTRARGLTNGRSSGSLRLRYLERADDVAAGDAVVTSGSKGYFPKGFPIGRVTSVRKTDFGISQEAMVEPVVSASNLEEVFVVIESGNEDFGDRLSTGFGLPLLSKINSANNSGTSTGANTNVPQKPASPPQPVATPSASSASPRPKPTP